MSKTEKKTMTRKITHRQFVELELKGSSKEELLDNLNDQIKKWPNFIGLICGGPTKLILTTGVTIKKT